MVTRQSAQFEQKCTIVQDFKISRFQVLVGTEYYWTVLVFVNSAKIDIPFCGSYNYCESILQILQQDLQAA